MYLLREHVIEKVRASPPRSPLRNSSPFKSGMSNISSQSVYSERLNIAGKKQNDEKRFERIQSKKTQQELILIDDMVRYWNIQLTFKTEEIRIDYLTDFDQTVAD